MCILFYIASLRNIINEFFPLTFYYHSNVDDRCHLNNKLVMLNIINMTHM